MKQLRNAALALLCALPMSACATSNLIEWAKGEESVYYEPRGEVPRGFVKPFFTVVWFPVALVWDAATLPFQAIGGVYPYGDASMVPDGEADIDM